jgi:DNA-nicking Smr family endonuclease
VPSIPFEIRREGSRVSGIAPGIDRAHLRRLRKGEPEPDWELDLHGLTAAEARRDLRIAIAEARQEGVRCLHVIHGRGRHSEGGAVLRESLPDWLAKAPLDRHVMAFATALPEDGGEGAVYVLLRRARGSDRATR